MFKPYRLFALALFAFILTIACDKNPNGPDYQKEIAVFGYLWGERALDEQRAILITYSQPLDKNIDIQTAALSGADVHLIELNSGVKWRLTENPDRPGYYFNVQVTASPEATYRLDIQADGKQVTATTTVPPRLEQVTELRSDTLNVVCRDNLSRSKPIFLDSTDPEQIILVDMYCREPLENAEYINPFDKNNPFPGDLEEYDQGVGGEPRHIMGIARLRELYADEYDGIATVYWYSSMIVFYGANVMQVVAIDKNYQNYIFKEHPALSGGVKGGIGVFGSVCGEQYDLLVMKDE
ncbi:DUF4249 family protein [candidate division KSB1 bacterium]|nr:DUF4249 family protein [candidate division KSB1 bacterium]